MRNLTKLQYRNTVDCENLVFIPTDCRENPPAAAPASGREHGAGIRDLCWPFVAPKRRNLSDWGGTNVFKWEAQRKKERAAPERTWGIMDNEEEEERRLTRTGQKMKCQREGGTEQRRSCEETTHKCLSYHLAYGVWSLASLRSLSYRGNWQLSKRVRQRWNTLCVLKYTWHVSYLSRIKRYEIYQANKQVG